MPDDLPHNLRIAERAAHYFADATEVILNCARGGATPDLRRRLGDFLSGYQARWPDSATNDAWVALKVLRTRGVLKRTGTSALSLTEGALARSREVASIILATAGVHNNILYHVAPIAPIDLRRIVRAWTAICQALTQRFPDPLDIDDLKADISREVARAIERSQRTSLVNPLPPAKDGPYAPGWFRSDGIEYRIRGPLQWRLLQALWGRPSRPTQEVIDEVYGDKAEKATEGALRKLVFDTNSTLLQYKLPYEISTPMSGHLSLNKVRAPKSTP
jgi:hypothetical protein